MPVGSNDPTIPAKAFQSRDYEYYATALGDQQYPCAFVDLDLIRMNADAVTQRAAGRPVRLASKSIRCREILNRLFGEYPNFKGVMCYSGREAAWLASVGFKDLLVAYPMLGRREIEAVCDAIAAGGSITLTIDSRDQMAPLAAIAAERRVVIPICIDADMSTHLPGLHFGVRRSPLHSPDDVVDIARGVAEHSSLTLVGLLTYEAQIAGLPDKVPGRASNALIRTLKAFSRHEIKGRRLAIVSAVTQAGFSLKFVNGGGTGSLASTREDDSVTELTAGSAFFSPGLFDAYSDFRYQPAAGFAIQVVRRPKDNIYTCHGGGYVASGVSGEDRLPKPFLPEGSKLLPLEGAGEVQTPVHYRGPVPLKLGDPIFFRHAKAGELCEHFDKLLLIADGRVVDEVSTYRGEGHHFL